MALRFGDVIVVPFPFTDQTAVKKRPAVVVSSERYNRERPDLILMAITSQVRPTPTVGEVAVVNGRRQGCSNRL
jgi:mRNA interferase MazF